MAKERIVKKAFNGGIISDDLRYRNEIEKHSFACSKLDNFIVTPQGLIKRRKGTRFLADISSLGDELRVIPFEFNRTQSNILLFYRDTDSVKLNVYDINGNIQASAIDTAISVASLREFQYKQVNDVIYIVHQDFPPQRLQRESATSWVFVQEHIKIHPTMDWEDNNNFTIDIPKWETNKTYQEGDIVTGKNANGGKELAFYGGLFTFGYPLDEPYVLCAMLYGAQYNEEMYNSLELGDELVVSGARESITATVVADGITYHHSVAIGQVLSVYKKTIKQNGTINIYFFIKDYSSYTNITQFPNEMLPLPEYGNDLLEYGTFSVKSASYDGFFQAIQDVPANTLLSDKNYWKTLYIPEAELTLISSNPYFTQDDVGSQISFKSNSSGFLSGNFNSSQKGEASDMIPAKGTVRLDVSGGIWSGTIALQQSRDMGSTWENIGFVHSENGTGNGIIERTIEETGIFVRVLMQERETASSDTGCYWQVIVNNLPDFVFKITSFISETEAKIKAITPCLAVFRQGWYARDAWSKAFGYPRTVEIFEERLVFAGNKRQPTTLWFSATNNWNIFSGGVLATDPMTFTPSADEGEPMTFLRATGELLGGTGVNEFSIGSRDSSAALSASLVDCRSQSDDGAEYIQPVKASNFLFYIKRGGLALHAINYDWASDGYNSTPLSTLAPELLSSGVVEMFNQLSPDNIIHLVLADGRIATFTYDKDNNVMAWATHSFGDGVISATAISTGKFKSVFLAVRRGEAIVLERLDVEEAGNNEYDAGNYIDCYGSDFEAKYLSKVQTLPFVYDKMARITSCKLYTRDSKGGRVRAIGDEGNKLGEWCEVAPSELDVGAEVSQSYYWRMPLITGFEEDLAIEVQTDCDAPFRLRAIGLTIQGY